MREARVLAEGNAVVEITLEQVADHLLLAAERIDAGIAGKAAGRNLSEWRIDDGADIGKKGDAAGIVPAGGRQHGERRIRVRLEGDRRRNEVIVVGREIDLGTTILDLADQAVEKFAAVGRRLHRSTKIEREICVAKIVHAGLEITDRLGRRHLADGVDNAAGARAAIKRRRRSAQDLDTLEIEGLQFPARIGRIEQLQTIKKQADIVGLEAADQEPVVAGIRTEGTCENAGRVPQNLVELAGLLVADLLAADHRHRLRRLHDGRVGLGARHAAPGDIAVDRTARILDDRSIAPRRLGLSGRRNLRRTMRAALRHRHCATARLGRGDHHRRQGLRTRRR